MTYSDVMILMLLPGKFVQNHPKFFAQNQPIFLAK